MEELERLVQDAAPADAWWSARLVEERSELLAVRRDAALPPWRAHDAGAMVSVAAGGGFAYAATSDLSRAGLQAAFGHARALARASAAHALPLPAEALQAPGKGRYATPVQRPAAALGLKEKYELLAQACAGADLGSAIVDRNASLWSTRTRQLFLSADGGRIEQDWEFLVPEIVAVASDGGETQSRSAAGQYNGFCQQGGLEVLERAGFLDDAPRVAREALELVRAPDCPTGELDLLLAPDQMMLQIHESIGHPLELDRILGDERNFAGTSFVTLDMFGHYRYGSPLLNVSFAPDVPAEFASYAFDDDGQPAQREWLIRDGILQRPLGGALSQARARALRPDIEGVANSRACSWKRPPIDRMANLNVEPGASSFEEMVASIDDGVLMRTNASWSIDDSRNKFQFGCEWGQRIRHGKLAEVVRRPNYRGISASFWRSLSMVGNAGTFEVMGTPFCGKGEPNQVIRVGHAAPACKFDRVQVFGGGK
ncbi:TldD/PmbA family protein [Ramlibacter sp. G-1-2-2]|uniref:TldD/PmbA family protein n=1 Tax=Ramlibacter agri TaxID=2728837 RepID=A0A848HEF8_9BURK|nr:TldD/PmbA family protein [Ramlibacter agri]NML45968.1 TldD/PmbA family protein [Ramlibacter agri]